MPRCWCGDYEMDDIIHGSLFSGEGGFDLAAEWCGWTNAFHCEINPFCQKTLKYYWPNAKQYKDIRDTDFAIWRGRIDVLSGGFPCQPYSIAGLRKGKDDDRLYLIFWKQRKKIMAKDPAFLFYPGDWLGGTMLLTRHQKGCYIDLLMAQFNHGPLSLEQIKALLGQDQAVWTVLQEKFTMDNNGRFFNEKLATEIEKRKKFTESRSNNKSGRKKSYDKSHDLNVIIHMENENENGNVNGIKGGLGENYDRLSPKVRQMFDLFIGNLTLQKNNMAQSVQGREYFLRRLNELSGGAESVAIEILEYSTFSNYKDLYLPKNQQNHERKNGNSNAAARTRDYTKKF